MVKRVLMPLAVAQDLPSVDTVFHLFLSTSEGSFKLFCSLEFVPFVCFGYCTDSRRLQDCNCISDVLSFASQPGF
jgi:hypothetical protein